MPDEIHVNVQSIRSYQDRALEIFNSVRLELEKLAVATVVVDFEGPNAFDFKTSALQYATTLNDDVRRDIQQIGDAVNTQTNNVVMAGGMAPGSIPPMNVQGQALSAPAPKASGDVVRVLKADFIGLKETVGGHCSTINQLFNDHLAALKATDWRGVAKQNAEQSVQRFTMSATDGVVQAETDIKRFIDEQMQKFGIADN